MKPGSGDYVNIHIDLVDKDVHLERVETGEEGEGGVPGSLHGLDGFAADYDQDYYNGTTMSHAEVCVKANKIIKECGDRIAKIKFWYSCQRKNALLGIY